MEILISGIFATLAFTFGACIGSFLNVVVYRIPAGLSLIHPPSRCPQCFHKLGKTENVPILGWLWLRGRCRWCKTPISSRYPLVETATGILFVLVFGKFGYSLETIGYSAFISWLIALSLIDLDTMTLPASLTKSGLVLGLIFQAILGWHIAQTQGTAEKIMFGVSGAVLGIWLLEIIMIVGSIILKQQAMGGGDGKLMATMGMWLGWKYILLSGFLACFLGAIVGSSARILGLLAKKEPMPFGPFIALGGVLTLFFGQEIITFYTNLFI